MQLNAKFLFAIITKFPTRVVVNFLLVSVCFSKVISIWLKPKKEDTISTSLAPHTALEIKALTLIFLQFCSFFNEDMMHFQCT